MRARYKRNMKKLPLAVLAIFKLKEEIFFIVRQNHLKIFPGYCSFPGGKVDQEDLEFKHLELNPRLMGAARRELIEELGYDLEYELKTGKIKRISHIGQAITPSFNPYRYEAHYLLIELEKRPAFILEENEIKAGEWMTPKSFLHFYQKGERIVIPPMLNILKALESKEKSFKSFDQETPANQVPCLESIFGVRQFMPLSNTLPPAERTNAFLIGDTLVDPSPRDGKEFEKLLNTLPKEEIKKILVTHHHGDHHQMAQILAKELKAEILLSSYTFNKIVAVKGKDHFKDIEVRMVKEGDIATTWLNEKVQVFEVPGHDQGQIALAPESLRWFLAGDLFQGVGTVVIGGEEGDMSKYFATLERVIKLRPKAVFPSHGIVLGGTNILEKTFEHRRLREKQVRQMFQEGLSEKEMLQRIYFDLPEPLHKYALANISSHLKKLKDEKLV